MARIPLLAVAIAWLAACGEQSNCTIELSGAVSGRYACDPALGWVSSTNQFNFTLIMPPSSSSYQVSAGMKFPGEPQETTYTELTPGAEGGVSVTSYATVAGVSTTETWRAGSDPVGNITLKFTKVFDDVVPGGKGYTVVGTLSAALQPQKGNGTTVNFLATFHSR